MLTMLAVLRKRRRRLGERPIKLDPGYLVRANNPTFYEMVFAAFDAQVAGKPYDDYWDGFDGMEGEVIYFATVAANAGLSRTEFATLVDRIITRAVAWYAIPADETHDHLVLANGTKQTMNQWRDALRKGAK